MFPAACRYALPTLFPGSRMLDSLIAVFLVIATGWFLKARGIVSPAHWVGVERLTSIKNARVLCFEHDNADMMEAVAKTPLWKSMPFVRANQFSIVPAVWYYGATFSAMNFCKILTSTLGKPV